MWNLHGSGIKPVSHALAGRFLTTGPPGKSSLKYILFFFEVYSLPKICGWKSVALPWKISVLLCSREIVFAGFTFLSWQLLSPLGRYSSAVPWILLQLIRKQLWIVIHFCTFYLFIFGCAGYLLLQEGLLQFPRAGLLFVALSGLLVVVGQGSNPCSLNWQADSYPLHQQGSPVIPFDGRNFHILKYMKVILTYTWCNSSFMITKTAHLWPIKHIWLSSVQFSCSVVSDSLPSHELQHARLPCPSATPEAWSNSCPSSHCTFALTLLKSKNGVIAVQASKLELDGHCGYGFRQVPPSLRTWIFWTVSDSKTQPDILKTVSASSCQLQPETSRSSRKTRQPFWTLTNPCLINIFISCTFWL